MCKMAELLAVLLLSKFEGCRLKEREPCSVNPFLPPPLPPQEGCESAFPEAISCSALAPSSSWDRLSQRLFTRLADPAWNVLKLWIKQWDAGADASNGMEDLALLSEDISGESAWLESFKPLNSRLPSIIRLALLIRNSLFFSSWLVELFNDSAAFSASFNPGDRNRRKINPCLPAFPEVRAMGWMLGGSLGLGAEAEHCMSPAILGYNETHQETPFTKAHLSCLLSSQAWKQHPLEEVRLPEKVFSSIGPIK